MMSRIPDINRNLAIYGDTILDTSADNFLFALDATSGKLRWENRTADYRERPAQATSGPIAAKRQNLLRPRLWITAHDAKPGKELWRTRTIPAPGEFGDETWGGVPFESRLSITNRRAGITRH